MSTLIFNPNDFNSKDAIARVRAFARERAGTSDVRSLLTLIEGAESGNKNRKSVLDAIAACVEAENQRLAQAEEEPASAPAVPSIPSRTRRMIGIREGATRKGGLRTHYPIYED